MPITPEHVADTTPQNPFSEARSIAAQHLDLREIAACAAVMASNHGQWRSRIARTAFEAAKERIAAQRDRLRRAGYASAWLDRLADARFARPLRDGADTDAGQIARTLAPCDASRERA